jgi:putative heme utilization carrier protein HutX
MVKGTAKTRCLYIHILFCRVRCTFCSFFQYASSKTMMEEYFQVLMEENTWKASQKWTQSASLQAVYVGGGTPTDLSEKQLLLLGNKICSAFPLTPDCEITLERPVNRFGEEKFESPLEEGFNRFSFVVQSLDTKVRRSAKRLDDGDYAKQRLQQILKNWKINLESYFVSGVNGVDLYQLTEMKGIPMERSIELRKRPHPADTVTKSSMFKIGVEFMAKAHQRRLSVNHWAHDNRERSLYNSLAKNTVDILPIGAGAAGNFGGLNITQSRDMETNIKAIKNRQFLVIGAMYAASNAHIINTVKTTFDRGVLAKNDLNQAANRPYFESLMPLFEAWQNNQLVEINVGYLSLTLAGQFWATTLAKNIIHTIQIMPLKGKNMFLNKKLQEVQALVKQALAEDPGVNLAALATEHGLTEGEVTIALPAELVASCAGQHAEAILTQLPEWGNVTTIVHSCGSIFEFKAAFPKGKLDHGYYNIMGKAGLHGHLRIDLVERIAFVSKLFHGVQTHHIGFYNRVGECIFKVYLGRDKKRQLLSKQVENFHHLQQELCA